MFHCSQVGVVQVSGLEWPLMPRADFMCRQQEKGNCTQLQDHLLTEQAPSSSSSGRMS